MPKTKLPYLEAMRRFERKMERKREKREKRDSTRREEARIRRRERQDRNRRILITHLRQQLRDAERFPSLFTAKQLSAIARNPELPAEARVQAAALLGRWLFAEPEDLEVHHVRGRRARRRD